MNKDFENISNQLVNHFEDEYFWYKEQSNGKSFISYTDNVQNVTGYTKDELLSMPGKGREIIFDDDIKLLRREINDFKNDRNRNVFNFEFRIVKKDNQMIWVKETMIVKRNNNGEIINTFGKVLNISSYKTREESLKNMMEELKNINSSKDNFISMLSHDLRAPFTSILGFSEILLNETKLSDSEKTEYLSYINDSSQNQLHLINDLLDWSRLQTGRLKIVPQRINAQNLVFNCVSSLTGDAVRKNLEIKVEVPESLYIQADERLITQMIINLLGNAVKFSQENKTVQINANLYNEKFSEFIIKDEVTGISEDNQAKLFKLGQIFSTEGTKGEKGTGLGLALAKTIVEKHGGELWFYSTPGEGTEFHFIVPSSANTILIVKKDEEKREKYIKLLKESFPLYQIISSGNGYEALGIIISQMPSLILTDHEMPLMNGFQLVQSIKREDKNLNIPVIAFINTRSDEINKNYAEYGVDTIEEEPFDFEKLKGKLLSILK